MFRFELCGVEVAIVHRAFNGWFTRTLSIPFEVLQFGDKFGELVFCWVSSSLLFQFLFSLERLHFEADTGDVLLDFLLFDSVLVTGCWDF